MVKNHEGNTPKNNILNNLHKNVEGMINRKMKASLEKIQSIYNDKLKVLRKQLEYKNKIINKLLETIENISNKAVQPYPLPIPQLHLEDDTNKSERKQVKVPEINNTSNNQKDSQQEMNNLNLGKTNSIEKQLNDAKIKKRRMLLV